MRNVDYDMKCFLAFSACSGEHPTKSCTKLVPLVQTTDEDTNNISTHPLKFNDDSGSPNCNKWATLLKQHLITDEGKWPG
jgi:hypothetical protein